MKTVLKNILLFGCVAVLAFVFRDSLETVFSRTKNYYFPCSSPIEYSIGQFDPQFGISKADFLAAMSQAEAIWEKPVGRDLFTYSPDGRLKVNLIYDSRQEATSKLKTVGSTLDNSKASYDTLKAQYTALLADYNQKKEAFEARVSAYETRRQVYEEKVASANSRGGANSKTYAELNTEREYLNQETAAINQLQVALNSEVSQINTLVGNLNQMAASLNINVQKFNTIGASLGGEFDEGLYKSGPDGEEIDIYQFDNKTKLIRIMAHELGHALGLEHVDDPKAIMYRLNTSINEKLTQADLKEIRAHCNLPETVGNI